MGEQESEPEGRPLCEYEIKLQCIKPKSRLLIHFHYQSHSEKGEGHIEPKRQNVIKNVKNRKSGAQTG